MVEGTWRLVHLYMWGRVVWIEGWVVGGFVPETGYVFVCFAVDYELYGARLSDIIRAMKIWLQFADCSA